jgi:uncharacterized membrane protein
MLRFEESIDVAMPVRVACDQWTQFAWFPEVMDGVDRVVQLGAVLFRPLDPDHTRVTLKLDVPPDGPLETEGATVGVLERRVKGDLERFRDHVQAAGRTGDGWRDEIRGNVVRPGAQA